MYVNSYVVYPIPTEYKLHEEASPTGRREERSLSSTRRLEREAAIKEARNRFDSERKLPGDRLLIPRLLALDAH